MKKTYRVWIVAMVLFWSTFIATFLVDYTGVIGTAKNTVTLNVNGNDSSYAQWTTFGTTPFLNDDDYNGAYSSISGQKIGYFSFQDFNMTAAILNWSSDVTASLEIYSVGSDYHYNVYINPNGTDYNVGSGSSGGWQSFDITQYVNTSTKLNNAQIYLSKAATGLANVTRARIVVNYTGNMGFVETAWISWMMWTLVLGLVTVIIIRYVAKE